MRRNPRKQSRAEGAGALWTPAGGSYTGGLQAASVRYVVRVVLGVVLGLIAVAALWFFGAAWWVGALVGALLGLVGFLGSFFLWTADRPEEGYEQVLFDLPNNLVSLVLILAFVGAAFAGGHWLAREKPAPVDPAVAASMNEAHDNLTRIYNQIAAGNYTSSDAAKAASAEVKAIQDALAALPPSPKVDLLSAAATSIQKGLAEITSCTDPGSCSLGARLAKADALRAKDPLDAYAA